MLVVSLVCRHQLHSSEPKFYFSVLHFSVLRFYFKAIDATQAGLNVVVLARGKFVAE